MTPRARGSKVEADWREFMKLFVALTFLFIAGCGSKAVKQVAPEPVAPAPIHAVAVDPDADTPIRASIDPSAEDAPVAATEEAVKPPTAPPDLQLDPTSAVANESSQAPAAPKAKPHSQPFVNLNPQQAFVDEARRRSNTRIIRLPGGAILYEPIDKTKAYNHH